MGHLESHKKKKKIANYQFYKEKRFLIILWEDVVNILFKP